MLAPLQMQMENMMMGGGRTHPRVLGITVLVSQQRCILDILQLKVSRPAPGLSSPLLLGFSSKGIIRFAPQQSLIPTNTYGVWRSRALQGKTGY